MATKQDSHINSDIRAPEPMPKVPNPGPLPMHYRRKLGMTDTATDPFGTGAVSTKNLVAGQKVTY